MTGYESSIDVTDLDATMRAIESHGGKMITPKFQIPTVGTCAYFQDTEGNVAGLMQYEGR